MEPVLVSIPEAQRALSVGRSTTYRLIAEGKLDTFKIGRRTLVRVSSIHALVSASDL